MGDWDPFACDDAAPAGGVTMGSGMSFSLDDTYPMENSNVRVVKSDFDKTLQMSVGKLAAEEPWTKPPNPLPDLSWYKPTCTLEAWKHTDVKCEVGSAIAYFTINNAGDGNKLSKGVTAGLLDAIFNLHARPDIRVAVFTAEGTIFCSGGDPKGDGGGGFMTQSLPADVQAIREKMGERALKKGAFPDGKIELGRLFQMKFWHVWATVPQFTICLANGSAMGDGVGCVTVCDYCIALEGAFFSLASVKNGLVPAGVAPYVVAKTGTGKAKRIFCTSENLSGQRAVEIGIVDEVVASIADGHKAIAKQCEMLTQCGPRTVQAAKELTYGVAGQQVLLPLMFYTSMLSAKVSAGEEAKQAAAAVAAGKPKPWETAPIKPLH